MHRLTATDTPMVRYTRTIFPSYANDAKVYIFNFDTNQQTQDFYDLLCKKVDKVGVSHTERHSVHH